MCFVKGGESAAAQVDSRGTLQELQQPQAAGARVHRSSGSRLTGEDGPPPVWKLLLLKFLQSCNFINCPKISREQQHL